MEQGVTFKPTVPGTLFILMGCAVSWLLNQETSGIYDTARSVSFLLLGTIGLSILFDWRKGLRNLIRIDIFALISLYFLIYFEFLFPQPNFELVAIPVHVRTSINLTLVGFAALAIGRHLAFGQRHPLLFVGDVRLRPIDYAYLLFGAFILANLHMWIAVNFNPLDWFAGLLEPRFSRPWSRGRYGDITAIVSELSLLGYVIPPLAGLIMANRKRYSALIVALVIGCFAIQSFIAFAGGTRNVLAIYIAGFIGGFMIVQKELKIKTLVICGLVAAVSFTVAANYMLQFRNIGLGRYIEEERYRPAYQDFHDEYLKGSETEPEGTYFVDYNLYNISLLVDVFPEVYDYLGWNLPYVAATKPIPRVLWPGKPTDLKVGMEEAVGASGYTIAATFVGEAYIAFGVFGVAVTGLLIGGLCGWWNHLASYTTSPLALAIYTSGFFALMITMRSLMFFTTALLPSIALLVFARLLYMNQRSN